ncbi:uncharacterized protein [Watersipora subatra]|uniref:uncharacterized protein n=1 Tax=Watersipora subatra TaxID=2589382 RepID=UPI00355AEA7F
MPQGHLILLSNFYGSYLNKSKFRASVIVNNAGIEQLATLGVEKLKEVKSTSGPKDVVYVLIVAGLTDVLIKSVEEGKNKLEITPNSTQLLETKMQWANSLLGNEGARLIWVVMPPISLRMYHLSEGWNLNKIPGMSNGLDKEQRVLNSLMYNYRNLCIKLNQKDAKKLYNGPYFTDLISDLSKERATMILNTGYFESDGISPTPKLVENWNMQVDKVFSAVENMFFPRSRTPPRQRTPPKPFRKMDNGDSWDLPPPRSKTDERGDRSLKRSYEGTRSASSSEGLHSFGRDSSFGVNNSRKNSNDRDHDRYSARSRDDYPPPKIPSLVDMAQSLDSPRHPASLASRGADKPAKEMDTAVQLLAATMQLGGGNPSNVQAVLKALMSQKENDDRRIEEERIKRRVEEERISVQKREEARRLEELKRREEKQREEARYREEMWRRQEEERRRREERLQEERRQREEAQRLEEERLHQMAVQKRAAEEQRLREIQIAAKLAMEQQKREEEQQRRVKMMQDQQAQMALMAVTQKVRDQLVSKQREVSSYNNSKTGNVLDRLNEKLRNDREKKEPVSKFDRNIAKDASWAAPVVLFSFVNRSGDVKPLRGIHGQKVSKTSARASDLKSRGQWIYNTPGNAPPAVGLLKIKVKRSGIISELESKVADYNNRLFDMLDEGDALIQEGRNQGYMIRRETDDPKSVKGGASTIKDEPKSETQPSAMSGLAVKSKDLQGSGDKGSQGNKIRDLRENLNKSANRRARSRTPNESSKHTANSQARRSVEDKPRWDKSDESEEELLWEDDHVSMKASADDDDVKFVTETSVVKNELGNSKLDTFKLEGCGDEENDTQVIKSEHDDEKQPLVDGMPDNFLTIDEAA